MIPTVKKKCDHTMGVLERKKSIVKNTNGGPCIANEKKLSVWCKIPQNITVITSV